MTLLPEFGVGWLGGWLLLFVWLSVFGLTIKLLPKDVVRKLYDESGWTPAQRTLTRIAKVLSLVMLVGMLFARLRVDAAVFWIGLALYVLGMDVLVVALVHFAQMPEGEPATNGLYRFSRNPQWVGLVMVFLGATFTTGSWLLVLLFCVTAVIYHFRILAEERSCRALYGESFEAYMKRVPRYLGVVRRE
jgi:protein-S-isoprenylcysteine O-methyltransferase Ste14